MIYVSIIAGPAPVCPAGREVGACVAIDAATPREALRILVETHTAVPPKAPASPGDRLDPAFAAQAVAGAYRRGGV